MTATDSLLNEREKTHGDWKVQSEWSQRFKQLMTETPNWESLTPSMRESLQHDAVKLTRILHGDPFHADHWRDRAGYAELVAGVLAR